MLLVGEAAMPDHSAPQTGVVPTRLLVLTWLPIVMHANIPVRDLQVVYRLAFLFIGHPFIFDLIH